jgi:hypothetical protein
MLDIYRVNCHEYAIGNGRYNTNMNVRTYVQYGQGIPHRAIWSYGQGIPRL